MEGFTSDVPGKRISKLDRIVLDVDSYRNEMLGEIRDRPELRLRTTRGHTWRDAQRKGLTLPRIKKENSQANRLTELDLLLPPSLHSRPDDLKGPFRSLLSLPSRSLDIVLLSLPPFGLLPFLQTFHPTSHLRLLLLDNPQILRLLLRPTLHVFDLFRRQRRKTTAECRIGQLERGWLEFSELTRMEGCWVEATGRVFW
jgi:hypothetical protein